MTSKQKKGKEKKDDTPSLEDYYQNKNFAMPKEKTFETIFEEPKTTKTGSEQLTSMKKFKRFLQFDDFPSSQKLRKRRNRARKLTKTFFDLTDKPAVDSRYLEEEPSTTLPMILINKKKICNSSQSKDIISNLGKFSPRPKSKKRSKKSIQKNHNIEECSYNEDVSPLADELTSDEFHPLTDDLASDKEMELMETNVVLQSIWL